MSDKEEIERQIESITLQIDTINSSVSVKFFANIIITFREVHMYSIFNECKSIAVQTLTKELDRLRSLHNSL